MKSHVFIEVGHAGAKALAEAAAHQDWGSLEVFMGDVQQQEMDAKDLGFSMDVCKK